MHVASIYEIDTDVKTRTSNAYNLENFHRLVPIDKSFIKADISKFFKIDL